VLAAPPSYFFSLFPQAVHFLQGSVDTMEASRHKALRKQRPGYNVRKAVCRVPNGAVPSAVTGGVPEWLKGTDCKSVSLAYVGSNPTSSTTAGTDRLAHRSKPDSVLERLCAIYVLLYPSRVREDARSSEICGYSSVVEQQPSKLNMRVRFPLPAPDFADGRCAVSSELQTWCRP
jgi:hypothetical protein